MFYPEVIYGRKVVLWVLGIQSAAALVALAVAIIHNLHVPPGSDAPAFQIVLWAAALVCAITGSILGSSLARERSHLDLVWTKPTSRTRYAGGVLLVDVGYLLITFAGALAFGYLIASVLEGRPVAVAVAQAIISKNLGFLLFPLAWFGLTQALSAGVASQMACGWLTGISWPVAGGLSVVSTWKLAAPFHAVLSFLNLVNPIGYFPFWEVFDDVRATPMRANFGYGLTIDTLALAALALVGVMVATALWRRLEA